MRDEKGFDQWADGYDQSVRQTEEADAYPFAGYGAVLDQIYEKICRLDSRCILDIGFGTGTLAKRLYQDGCEIYGVDFSSNMIELARQAMPRAHFIRHDFSRGLPKELDGLAFDAIVSTYALHHLSDGQKVSFLQELLNRLTEKGAIFIGDVAFETKQQLCDCKKRYEREWDEEEFYPVFERLAPHFSAECFSFLPVSHCAGIFTLTKNQTA